MSPSTTPWTLAITTFIGRPAPARFTGRRPFQRPDLTGTVLREHPKQGLWHRGPEGLMDAQPIMLGQRVIRVPGRVWPVPRPEECPSQDRRVAWFDAAGQEMSESEVADLGAPEPVVMLCLNCGLQLG
ncbi:hypothetical protein AB0A63_13845 [Lentzea sp. NPDC042327]|uniref:hypothetical protein n=1 Tax=Lentzea sp. NPDC042327 TaxID=3154801 RepID=UPI0033D9967F